MAIPRSVNLHVLASLNSTAQDILTMFQLQPMLLQAPEAQLLNNHAYHISVHHSPFAILKNIDRSGRTVWEDGVDSQIDVEEVEDVS